LGGVCVFLLGGCGVDSILLNGGLGRRRLRLFFMGEEY